MKPFRYILPLLLPLLLSCVRESSRGDAFEASFTLDTETVYNGDEFAFTIRCNRSSFRILSFEFHLAPGAIQPYTLCPTRDGAWSFRERVSVPESGKGRIALVIEDPDTGLQKEFSADYTAYASTGVNLIIENERVTSKYLPHGLPAVVGGDDFRFTLHGRPQRLILEAFECEFNDSTLVEGMELLLPEGDTTFCIPSVQAGDAFSPRTLSLTFRSLDSGKDTTLSATYVTAAPFVPEATLVDPHLIEGEKGTLRLRANRGRFELREYAAPSWFILDGWSADDPGVSLNMEGYAAFTTKALAIDESGAGTIRLELVDSEYTLRSVIVSVPYEASVKGAPANVILSESSLTLTTDGFASVGVSTTSAHSTGLFTARVVSGEGITLYAPTPGESTKPEETDPSRYAASCDITDGRLYLRGNEGKWGAVTVRVFSKGNEKVYKDLSLYLRRDVALRIKGDVIDDICYYPDSIDDIFSDLAEGKEGIGWYGMPRSIEAELVSFENRSSRDLTDLKKEDVSAWVKTFSLADGSASRLSVSFTVTVGSRVTSRFFYGAYAGEQEPKSRLLTGNGIDRTQETTLPSSINTTATETAVYGNRVSCKVLLRLLRNLDCHADYQNGYGLFTMLRETLHAEDHLGFGTFDVALTSLEYDHARYRVLWVMNLLEVPGEWGSAAPWWREVPGERPWCIPYDD